jgi:4-hydroxymandelate oxidase
VNPVPDSAGSGPSACFDLFDFERAARHRIPPVGWEYLIGGAADELTIQWNVDAYRRVKLMPRALVDVSRLDTGVTLFGRRHAHPILLSPVAYQKLFHPEGELATARGAAEADATLVVSTQSNTTIEEISAAGPGTLWFQLYVQRDREFTAELVQRAEAAGCEALVVTIDTPVLGPRGRELRSRFALPPGIVRAHHRPGPAATESLRPTETNIYSPILDPSLTWNELGWLRQLTKLPILVKGILNPDDADRAVAAGVSGIIVSNHGGRNLDTVPATIEVLAAVAGRVQGRVPILVDGGIRRGTDIVKAVALGATAVMIGRPYVYGLAVEGAAGVTRIVTMLRRELEMAMALMGRPTLAAIDASAIWRGDAVLSSAATDNSAWRTDEAIG